MIACSVPELLDLLRQQQRPALLAHADAALPATLRSPTDPSAACEMRLHLDGREAELIGDLPRIAQ